ncbi:nucleotidyltransferase family protein [Agaribacterium haliotis]|uniref:nucleotidyltransferase family protein n=1 Tax=Agaribacterium haliotis TaxID=2013869 RepID=UPI000BB59331|nr:nucleotidyltransferase family protein [Agaribacterium haliotis]
MPENLTTFNADSSQIKTSKRVDSLQVVLLAAGASRRLGQEKALVAVGEHSLLRHKCLQLLALKNALAGKCKLELSVVLGASADKLRAELDGLELRCVLNENWQQGMSTSVLKALACAKAQRSALMLCLLDQWRLKSKDYLALYQRWCVSSKAIACAYAPEQDLLLAPMLCAEHKLALFSGLHGDKGAAAILRNNRSQVLAHSMPEALIDLDSEDDLRQMRKQLKQM